MRSIGTPEIYGMVNVPDSCTTLVLTAATANGAAIPSNAKYMRLTILSSAGGALSGYANLQTTGVAIPAEGTSAGSSSSGVNIPVTTPRLFSIAASSAFSVIANSSGYAHAEFWGY